MYDPGHTCHLYIYIYIYIAKHNKGGDPAHSCDVGDGQPVQPTRPLHSDSAVTFGMPLLVEEPLGKFGQKFAARAGSRLAS